MITRAIIFVLLLWALPATADENFVATFVPQPGTGSSATGSATFTLNATQTAVSYNITITGLSSAEVAAHIHRADGSIAVDLPLGSSKIGVWSDPGFIDVTALQLEQLFILVHTDNHPFGEVRGNILMQGVPVETSTWGGIKALYR